MDQVHKETDEKLKEIEEKVKSVYDTAQKEAKEKLDTYLKQFTDEDKEKQADVQAGDMTWTQYKKWRQDKILTGNRYRAMSEQLTSDYVNADKIAMSIVNGFTPEVYAMNYNYGTYEAESGSMVDTSFTLYDRQTVERLIRDDPDLLPKANVDIPKDKRWNRQKLNSAITQGVLQGDSIPDISKRLQSVTDMDRRAAIRNARTMTTSAENGGRQDSYTRAESMGIKMKKQWMATLDSTTRDSHVMADGQVVGTKDTFHLMHGELEYPGDPAGPPAEVYNCRCTMTAIVDGVDEKLKYQSGSYTNTKLGEVTYDEWKDMHSHKETSTQKAEQKTEEKEVKDGILDGHDIRVMRPQKRRRKR